MKTSDIVIAFERVEIPVDLSVAVADLFIDLSIFEMDRGSFTVRDVRLGVLQLAVSSLRCCGGIVDLNAGFPESILKPGDGEAEFAATGAAALAGVAKSGETFAESTGGAP